METAAAGRRRRPVVMDDDGGGQAALALPQEDQGRQATVEGVVARVVCNRAPEFMVFRIEPDGGGPDVTVSARGCPDLSEGLRVRAGGGWKETKYGRQLEAAWVAPELSSLAVVAAGFLRTRVLGIGPVKAAALVAKYGDRLPDALRDERMIRAVHGIGRHLASEVVREWTGIGPEDMADLELAGLGVSESARSLLLEKFGAGAADAIKRNPWIACKVRGLGVADADRIALQLGVPLDCPERAQAVVLHVLDDAARSAGSTRVTRRKVFDEAEKKGIDADRTEAAVKALVEEEEVVLHQGGEVGPAWLDRCERGIATHLRRLARTWTLMAGKVVPQLPREAPGRVVPTPEQADAVVNAMRSGVMVLTGGPGTGKTTITRLVCDAFVACGVRITCCSPTGRAAERLREASGQPAATIHRLLEWRGGSSWGRGRSQPLAGPSLFVVDEFSMVDTALMWRLLEAIPDGSAVLLVGDHRQLPSVGPGACLRDLVETAAIPVHVLTKVHRQAAGNPVIAGCHAILQGRVPEGGQSEQGQLVVLHKRRDGSPVETAEQVADAVVASVEWIRSKGFGKRDVQVLSPGKKSPCGTYAMNRRLRKVWLPDAPEEPRFVSGSVVMQLRNDRDLGIWNGTQGEVVELDVSANGRIEGGTVEWEGRGPLKLEDWQLEAGRVQEAFDATVHKAQGSQWPWVVIPMCLSMGFPLHVREVIYTALSRAQVGVVLLGPRKAMQVAVSRSNARDRRTGLQEYLVAEMARPESDPLDSVTYRGEPDTDDERREYYRWTGDDDLAGDGADL